MSSMDTLALSGETAKADCPRDKIVHKKFTDSNDMLEPQTHTFDLLLLHLANIFHAKIHVTQVAVKDLRHCTLHALSYIFLVSYTSIVHSHGRMGDVCV
jgi:hypothetical protein